MQYWKKVNNFLGKFVLFLAMFIPLLIFLNRFLLPDMSFDSVNYHVFSGDRLWNFWKFFNVEFYPTGLHSFSQIFDYFGGIFRFFLGYRLGSICSLVFLYGIIFLIWKIVRLFVDKKFWLNLILVLFFINTYISLELYLQLGTYYVDIIGSFFVIWALYISLLYFKFGDNKYFYISAILMGISVAGKLTNLTYLIPLVLINLFFCCKGKLKFPQRAKNIILFVILALLPICLISVENEIKTGNPFFPFYNSIFKSKFYPQIDFQNTNFGGTNFVEKLLWPIYSVMTPERLSEAHDLFNDFKLNLYFVILLFSMYFSYKYRKDNKLFWYFNLYYFMAMMLWSLTFGYLRYALVLEILGGIIVFVWVEKIVFKLKYDVKSGILLLIISILLSVLGYMDKLAININLAYDLSWRKTFTYNREEYLNEIGNLFVNKIEHVDLDKNLNPELFLNCSAPGLAFYSLSQFNSLPVVNIDSRASGEMTSNILYANEVNKRLHGKYGIKEKYSFVTIVGNYGLTNQIRNCLDNLETRKYKIIKQIPIDNFLRYNGQKLVYIFGEYTL